MRLPLRVTLPVSPERTVTKLTPDAVESLIATARVWPMAIRPATLWGLLPQDVKQAIVAELTTVFSEVIYVDDPVAQPHHLSRKAVIYIRQSTGHQVLTNTESQQLQHAMREHARHLGWPDERIEVVETDLGRSAQSTAGRDGYKPAGRGGPGTGRHRAEL